MNTASSPPAPTAPPGSTPAPYRFSVAPMMDWSDRHCRYFWRLITKYSLLYTEMVTTGALLNGDAHRFLQFHPQEHPVAIQLGGSDPEALARCAEMAQSYGYDEVNLNCGCPSDRVQEGKIGAVLMLEPERVAECVYQMRQACDIPVTVKHRIGVDDQDDYPDMLRFVETVADAGCKRFIVHARKAWLKGLSPKENREKPPLNYQYVKQLKAQRPDLTLVINGGITSMEQCDTLLQDLDGVMVGREAYQNPYFLAGVDAAVFGDQRPAVSRETVLQQFASYCDTQLEQGQRLHHMSRHILGLFSGQYGARIFRRHITEHANRSSATSQLLLDAMQAMSHPAGSNA